MIKRIKDNSKMKYFISYTALFCLVSTILFSYCIINGKTLIGYNDSYAQHYPYLLKVKAFYETFLVSFFTGKGFALVDFNSYFGMNTIATLNYYGLGNPLYLLTIGWSESAMPFIFSILMVLKMYLGGLAFSHMCFTRNSKKFYVLLGAIIYAFNPFAIASLEQLSFYDVLYQFPLLVIGFNKILNDKKSKTFVVAVMLTALSGYYFLYIMTVMLAVYGVVVIIHRNNSIKEVIKDAIINLWKTIIHYLLGIMLSAPIFIPSVLGFFESYREGGGIQEVSLLYDIKYYLNEIVKLLFYNSDTYFSLNIMMILVLVVLFFKFKGKHSVLKLLIILSLVGSQFPIVGSVMNGFAYPSNRWLFGFYLVISVASVDVLSILIKNNKKERVFAIIVVLGCVIPQAYYYTSQYGSICLSKKQIRFLKENTTSDYFTEGYRVDGDSTWMDNTSLFYDVSKAQVYTSLIPKIVMQGQLDMELATVENTNIIAGLDSRAELQALFNIKYFLTKNANSDIPYGFDEIEKTKTGKVLFVNKNELPFGYTYNSCVEESKLTELSGIDRSWICMDTAVVSSNNIPEVEYKKDIEGSLKNIEISVERQSDMTKVSFDNINNSEVYVKLYGNFDKLHTDEIIIGDKTKFIKFENLNSKWYIDREYMFYHIGYFESISEFLISGNYEYDKIEVYYHLMDDYTDKINNLSKYHLENVVFDSNRISGNIEVPESRLLCITVPKINGWKAYIDGREANIIKINGMFIGLHIHPGRHNVELEFRPPGLYIGLILHSVAVLIIIANLMVTKYTRSGIDGKNHRTGRNTSKA